MAELPYPPCRLSSSPRFSGLLTTSDSVELKLSVPDGDRRSAVARWAWTRSTPRSARSCSSTRPTSQLNQRGVVVRVRRVQGRSGRLRGQAAAGRARRAAGVAYGTHRTSASRSTPCPAASSARASMKAQLDRRGEGDAGRAAPLRKLFSKEQRDLYAATPRSGSPFDDLTDARADQRAEAEVHARGLRPAARRRAVALPGRSRVLELSTKCAPAEAFKVAAETRRSSPATGST